MRQMKGIEIIDKMEHSTDKSSKKMSRKEFYFYIFGDLVKGLYIVGSMFFDLIIIPQIMSYFPAYIFLPSLAMQIGPILVPGLYIIIIIALIIISSFFEVKTYLKLWHVKSL